jgi:hypothetical protein
MTHPRQFQPWSKVKTTVLLKCKIYIKMVNWDENEKAALDRYGNDGS